MGARNGGRAVLGWMLFDWANQPFYTLVVTFVFAPYFATTVIADPVRGQATWGAATAVAGTLVALLAPILGAIADRTGARKRWILAFSVPFVLGCCGLWWAEPAMADPVPILVLFALAYIGSEFTLIFTNAMLPDLGPRAQIGRISGSGWALGYAGGLVALALVLGLVAPAPGGSRTLLGLEPLFGLDPAAGEPARATAPFSALWYLVFAAPLFAYAPDMPAASGFATAARAGLSDLGATLRGIGRHRDLALYLLAAMFYRDALNALFVFGGIYAAGVLGWGLVELGVFGIVAAGTGALGAWTGGRADSAFGPRPVITIAIWTLIGLCLVILLTSRGAVLLVPVAPGSTLPDAVFLGAGALLGAMAGALQAASRTLLVHVAEGRIANAQAFGLYALSGKATAFLGPALVAAATAVTGSQRLGAAPLIVLFLIGLVLLYWSQAEAGRTDRRHT